MPTSTRHNAYQKEIGMRFQYVTPRQTCLQPNGTGRNLLSSPRWFTGLCNSHKVSHFAAFFIDEEIIYVLSRIIIYHVSKHNPHRNTTNIQNNTT